MRYRYVSTSHVSFGLACIAIALLVAQATQARAQFHGLGYGQTTPVFADYASNSGLQSNFSNQAGLDRSSPQRLSSVVGLELGVIALSREAPSGQVLAVDDLSNVIFDASQLQGTMGSGLDATFTFFNLFSDQHAVDLQTRFFQAGNMNARETVTSNENTTFFFNAVPATPVETNEFIYDTRLRSAEVNLVARSQYRLRFLLGYRFFEADERFDIMDPGQNLGVFSRAENTMNGLQIGSEATLLTNGHSRIFGSFKWGVMNNHIVGTATAVDPVGGGSLQADTYDSQASQLLDFQLGGSLSFSQWFSLYAGYQGLVVSDLALALEQSRNGGIVSQESNPVYFVDTQYHGFRITGMATW